MELLISLHTWSCLRCDNYPCINNQFVSEAQISIFFSLLKDLSEFIFKIRIGTVIFRELLTAMCYYHGPVKRSLNFEGWGSSLRALG